MSALTQATVQLVVGGVATYADLIDRLVVIKNRDKQAQSYDVVDCKIKVGSTKTIEDYSNIKLSDDVKHRLCPKYLDPLSGLIVELDQFKDIVDMPRTNNYILIFDYPVSNNNTLETVPVIFKIEANSKNVSKFSIKERDALLNITQAVYNGVALMLRDTDPASRLSRMVTMNALLLANAKLANIENPLQANTTGDDLIAAIEESVDYSVYISCEGDDFSLPQLFNPLVAEALGVELELDTVANDVFLARFKSGLVIQDQPESSTLTTEVVETTVYIEGVFNEIPVKYVKPVERPCELVEVFLPLTQSQYFEKYDQTSNRVANLKVNYADYLAKEDAIPADVMLLISDITPDKVAEICGVFHKTRGMELVRSFLVFFHCDFKMINKCMRYDFNPLEYLFATLHKSLSFVQRRSTAQRVAGKNILTFYWAYRNMRTLLNSVGIHTYASSDEMLFILRRLYPAFFDFGPSSAQVDISQDVPATQLPVASKLTLALDRYDAVTAATPKTVSKSTTVQSLPSTMRSGDSSLATRSTVTISLPASKAGSSSSGYCSDRFATASAYGINCISGSHSVQFIPKVPDFNAAQNVLSVGIDLISTNFEHIYYEDGQFKFHTWLNNPAHINDQAVRVCKEDSFIRFYDISKQVKPTRIKLTPPQVDDTMSLSLLDAVMTGINVDTRKWVSQLMGELRCDRKLAEQMAPLLIKHLERYNNSTIYAIGHMLQMALTDFENDEVAPVFGPIPENSIVTFNTNTIIANVNGEVANMESYLAEGRIMLKGKDLNSRDYAVMKLISAGPSVIRVDDNSNDVHIISSIICERAVQWCVINDEDSNVPAQVGSVTSAHVSAFLTKLVNTFKDSDAMVSGFIQAATILNGKIEEMHRADQLIHRFVLATLEIGQINLPRPRGHNWMWSVIHLEPARCNATFFKDDLVALHGANTQVQNRLSVFVALVISIGISTFLDCWNITGADMTSSCLPPDGGNNFGIVFDTLTAAKGKIGAPILTIACGFINQVSEMTINPSVFNGRGWCDNLNAIRSLVYEPRDLWQAIWDEYIPYLIEPLAAAFLFKAWPSIWHILAPDVSFEITKEINMLGPLELRQWDASTGCDGYKTIGVSKTPWVKESYGGLMISALRQQFNVREDWQITLQVFHQAGNQFVKSSETIRFQPQYDPDFGTIKIGTLVTYNWSVMRTLVPALSPNTIGHGYFHMLSCVSFNNFTSAGIYLPNVQSGHAVSVGVFTDTGIQGMEVYSSGQTIGSARTESEN